MNKELWITRARNYCGLLGMLLPWLALFSAGIAEHPSPTWWYSISATYYQSPALVGILTAASILLMTYDGYDLQDNLVTTFSGVFGLGIVLFPCSVNWLNRMDPVGFFQIPMTYSNKIHCACAALFFVLLAYNSFFLFTKYDGNPTKNKLRRNIVYKVCGLGMLVFMIFQIISVQVSFLKGYWTMINEIFLLQFFGISWLTKGGAIKFLND